MKHTTLLKYTGGFVILVAGFLLGFSFGGHYTQPANDQNVSDQTASLMIDYGNGKLDTFTNLSIPKQAKVFDLLKSAVATKNIKLEYKDYGGDLGVFIESIHGIGKNTAGQKWWQYWVNNSYSYVGVSGYEVKPGDVIELKFIEGQS